MAWTLTEEKLVAAVAAARVRVERRTSWTRTELLAQLAARELDVPLLRFAADPVSLPDFRIRPLESSRLLRLSRQEQSPTGPAVRRRESSAQPAEQYHF
jgi:hypothetical protein